MNEQELRHSLFVQLLPYRYDIDPDELISEMKILEEYILSGE